MVAGSLLAAAAVALLGGWLWLAGGLPDIDTLDANLLIPSVRIVDRQGRLLYEAIGGAEGRHNVVALDSIPQPCIDATIATEDANFYRNPGVDARAIVRAVWINLRGGEVLSGGSTITQQVVRNLLLDPDERAERTLVRKLREGLLAYRLTRHYSKADILELYLNQIYYGNLAYGIDAAARAYFGKSAAELGLAECALLAGLPQAPAVYDPLVNPAVARERQAVVLGLMQDGGYISDEQAELARQEPLAFASQEYPILAPHFVTAVYAQVTDLLPADTLRQGGLVVRTTLDLDWQRAAERIVRQHLASLNQPQADQLQSDEPPHNAHNAALVALDPHTGQVLAMLGSPDYFDEGISGAINMALAPRQPGSTLKPFTYALALDPDQDEPWTTATMILDVHTSFVTHEGFAYAPVNFDLQEHGPVLVREALASSYNIPAVITLDRVGIAGLLRLLARLGITTLTDPSEYDLSVTLGGGEVRLLELVAAYAALANGGSRVEPVLVLEVTDADGTAVFNAQGGPGDRVISQDVAWLITDILADNTARAPSFSTHSVLQIGRPAAAKTGTTTDFRDNWTVGYTPNLVVGVWVGNTDGSAMVNVSGISGAGPIWHQFMRTVLRGQPALEFERPDNLVQVEVCTISGLLPTPDCPYRRREWFIAGTEPVEVDTVYQRVAIDRATGQPASDSTPLERREERLFLNLPLQARAWAARNGLLLLPEAWDAPRQDGAQTVAGNELRILAPDSQSLFRIDPALPLDAQRLRIIASGPLGMTDVTLFVDGIPLATLSQPPFEVWWGLTPGEHIIEAEGVTAEGQRQQSRAIVIRVSPPQ
jgi:1A family penicillin-binding protein